MLKKLKDDLDSILELVKKCPTELQEVAFKTLLEHWLRVNVPAVAPAGSPTRPPSLGAATGGEGILPQSFRPFMVANSLTEAELGKVFHPLGSSAQLVTSELPGQGKSGKQIALVLLLSVRQAMGGASFGCALEELRQMCLHYDCYDSPNFAANLKKNSQLFKPRKKGEAVELSAAGMKRAASYIKQLAGIGG